MRKTGTYQILGSTSYFIPDALPPTNPSLTITDSLLQSYEQAIFSLGKLNEISRKLPNKERFIKAYIFKEALLSSEIENIHTTLLDVFTQSFGATPIHKETNLIIHYTQALQAALHMMQQKNMPLTEKIIRIAHQELMNNKQGSSANPGQYRKQSVKVGNLIPPPPLEIPRLMSDLEQYININEPQEAKLIKAGLAHVQFETIHPFLDGNGRIGRLLIVLMLMQDELLHEPIIYPSYYFKKHHHEYYHRLDRVRTHGDFEGWISFYLQAIHFSAHDAYQKILQIEALEHLLQEQIKTNPIFIKIQETALSTLQTIFSFPVINATRLSTIINKSFNTAQKMLKLFEDLKIISKITDQKRNKLYQFDVYLKVLNTD